MDVYAKTHLIVTNITNNYKINWCGKIKDAAPLLKNGKPIFVIISAETRVELNTISMQQIENCAKRLVAPKGKSAITKDKVFIYLKEVDGNEKLMGSLSCERIKEFAPMYDKVGYREYYSIFSK